MTLENQINALPTVVGNGNTGHHNNHQVIHAALKDHVGKVEDAVSKSSLATDEASNAIDRVTALEALSGLSPESPVDGQTANILLQPDSLSRAALNEGYITRDESPLMLLDYAVGDGKTDDTAAVQQAIDDAITQKRELYSPLGFEYAVGGVTVSGRLILSGSFTFSALGEQDYIIRQTTGVDWRRAKVVLNGRYNAKYGLLASGIGRSEYGHIATSRNRIWGFKILSSGNSNLCTVEYLKASINGSLSRYRIQQTERTDNWRNSLHGYGVGMLDTPLPSDQLEDNASYFVIVGVDESGTYFDLDGEVGGWSQLPSDAPDGSKYLVRGLSMVHTKSGGAWSAVDAGERFEYRALKIRELNENTISAYNMGGEVGSSFTIWLPSGGGVDWESYNNSGVWTVSASDISDNRGIGMHCATMYGHTLLNPVIQGNAIGFACVDYTLQMTFDKPYFETSRIDYVSHRYVNGVMQSPIMDISKIQNIQNRVQGGRGNHDAGLVLLTQHQTRVRSSVGNNPGGRTLQPGRTHTYSFSAGNTTANITVSNSEVWDALGAKTAMLSIVRPTGSQTTISISLEYDNGDTIEGGSSYQVVVSGCATLEITRIDKTWRVIVLRDPRATNTISRVPEFVGQTAVSGGTGYMAVGTGSVDDWKQITSTPST